MQHPKAYENDPIDLEAPTVSFGRRFCIRQLLLSFVFFDVLDGGRHTLKASGSLLALALPMPCARV